MKIQGSTQMPASVPQTEMDAVQRTSKKDKADAANGPASTTNKNERTAPEVQPRNPASRKFEGHAVAADLNAKFDNINGPKSNNVQEWIEVVIESMKHDDPKKES